MRYPLLTVFFLAGMFLSCGGGGSGNTTSAPTPNPNPSPSPPPIPTPVAAPRSSYDSQKTDLHINLQILRGGRPGFALAVAYADFDGDGDTDVLVAPGDGTANRTPVEFYRNDAGVFHFDSSVFTPPAPAMVHARKALVGDFNGDGHPDVFLIGHGFDQPPFPGEFPLLLLNDGHGRFTTTAYDRFVSFQHGGSAADIDHDGDLDIFVASATGDPYFLINRGNGVFDYDTTRVPSGARGSMFTAELIDVDGDGNYDLLLSGHEMDGFSTRIYWGDAAGTFAESRRTDLPAVACQGAVIDIDAEDLGGDGDRDIVLNRTSGGCGTFSQGYYVQVLRNRGNRVFEDATASAIVNGSSATANFNVWLRLQDLNGDGKPDLLVDDAGANLVWLNDGTGRLVPR